MVSVSDKKAGARILVIQTASAGDVILATPVIEKIHDERPDTAIDFLLKKGNESLFEGHPFINEVIVWNKNASKYRNLPGIIRRVRSAKYDQVINLQRFFSTGLITALSGAKIRVGFDKNPFSWTYHVRKRHSIGESSLHETERNLSLIGHHTQNGRAPVKLYPTRNHFASVARFKKEPYICIAPASLWFTKQYPVEKWIEFIRELKGDHSIYLLGSGNDYDICKYITDRTKGKHIEIVAGSLTFLETAALMKDAEMNFVNDSAPLHLASAMDAPVTAIFCSTVPAFGFGPLSSDAAVVETEIDLECRPCGLHGYPECPLSHFKCAFTIDKNKLIKRIEN